MARKGSQQKNGMEQHLPNHKKGVTDSGPAPAPVTTEGRADVDGKKFASGEELSNGVNSSSSKKTADGVHHAQEGKKNKKKTRKPQNKEKKVTEDVVTNQAIPCGHNTEIGKNDSPPADESNVRDAIDQNSNHATDSTSTSSFDNLPSGLGREDGLGNVEFPETVIFKFMRTAALSLAKASAEWVERQKPGLLSLKASTLKVRDHVQMKIQIVQPILFKWIMHVGNIMLLLFMVWLDCTLRGIDSFIRMGTTSFFSIVWCGVFSVVAMAGISKFLMILAASAAVGLFLGFALGLILAGFSGAILLWFYGSFWTTGFIILLGGLAFVLGRDRFSLFIISSYSAYCACNYVGWLGLLLGLNLSFISSDVILYFLRNVINEQRRPNTFPDQAAGREGQPSFSPNGSAHATFSESGTGLPGDRSSGVASTSGTDSEITSEDEVVRLLNCQDHYAALGLTRYGDVDVSVVKREYRKKAMLVHPDKNMGNEKAADAFKKLQNAYEVLMDSLKRKEYDDELRREELLSYFRELHNAPHEHRRHGIFSSTFGHREAGSDDLTGEPRRIACKKCGFFHIWFLTKKLKSRARWCQECKEFHPAKDGDGWVEQSSQPFLFGMLQKVDAPSAYVCADGKVYDATEWYICQGMRCSVNSHKPTFHVNTSIVSKNNHTKASSSGQRGGIPTPNMEETMTEEEFFEWLQNAMQSGGFENFNGSSNDNSPGFSSKSSGSNSNNTSNKKKKKGKKQW